MTNSGICQIDSYNRTNNPRRLIRTCVKGDTCVTFARMHAGTSRVLLQIGNIWHHLCVAQKNSINHSNIHRVLVSGRLETGSSFMQFLIILSVAHFVDSRCVACRPRLCSGVAPRLFVFMSTQDLSVTHRLCVSIKVLPFW